ncbi:MAG: MBL fold metallo-hydrolase, partial [Gemmatimonadota bacterium]
MSRLVMRAACVCALACACLVLASGAQAQQPDVQVQTIEVAPGLYMLVGRGGNVGVSVGEDGVFLVDDQYAPLTEKILAAIRELSDQPVRFVINTH